MDFNFRTSHVYDSDFSSRRNSKFRKTNTQIKIANDLKEAYIRAANRKSVFKEGVSPIIYKNEKNN